MQFVSSPHFGALAATWWATAGYKPYCNPCPGTTGPCRKPGCNSHHWPEKRCWMKWSRLPVRVARMQWMIPSLKKKKKKTAERNDCKELFVGHWTLKMSIPVQSLACLLVLPNCLRKRHSSTRKPWHSYVLRTSQVDTCNKTPRRQYCGGTCLRMSQRQTSTQSLRMELTPSTSTD